MPPTPEQIAAGHAVYTTPALRWYDLLVLGISNNFIWRCPTRELLDWCNQHVSANHLDVGVGTGFFLDRCRFPDGQPRLGMLDPNASCLAAAARRVARYHPEIYEANILEPLQIGAARFDSVGLNYVLHCLPGSLTDKSACLDHLSELLNPGGVIFGSTLLQGGVRPGWAARRLMAFYNRKRIFCNLEDDFAQLQQELRSRFAECTFRVVGCAALFAARM